MDEELERAIDKVGRQRVLDRASELGWSTYNPPPKHVWVNIIEDVRAGRGSGMPPQRWFEDAVLGFRLF